MYITKDWTSPQGQLIKIWQVMYIVVDYLHDNIECDMRGWVNIDGPVNGEKPVIRKVIMLDKPFPLGINEGVIRAQLNRDKYWSDT